MTGYSGSAPSRKLEHTARALALLSSVGDGIPSLRAASQIAIEVINVAQVRVIVATRLRFV